MQEYRADSKTLYQAIQYKGRETNDTLFRNFGEKVSISGRISETAYIKLNDSRIGTKLEVGDFIIVDKEDVLLIYPKSKEQDIKLIANKLKK